MKISHLTLLSVLFVSAQSSILAGDLSKTNEVFPPSDDGWEYSITPYFMAAGLSGDVGVGGVTNSVDAAFGDIKDSLEAGLAGYFEARKGKWGLGIDGMWLKLGGSSDLPAPLESANLDLEVVRMKGLVHYRTFEDESSSFDVYAGVSYNYVDMQLNVSTVASPSISLRSTEGWFDPVVGVRYSHEFNEKWFTRLVGEIGGGVSSEFNWEAMGVLGYHISSRWDAVLAYRGIGTDYSKDGFVYDVTMSGPMLGVTFNW